MQIKKDRVRTSCGRRTQPAGQKDRRTKRRTGLTCRTERRRETKGRSKKLVMQWLAFSAKFWMVIIEAFAFHMELEDALDYSA